MTTAVSSTATLSKYANALRLSGITAMRNVLQGFLGKWVELMETRTISKVVIRVMLAASCLALSPSATAADAPRRIEVVAKRFSYAPGEITLKKGEPVVLVFRSDDVAHGVKFKELNLQTEIGKGVPSQLSFTPTQVGDFVGHCSRFCGAGHGSMTLTLHVTE